MAKSLGFQLELRLGYLKDLMRWMVDLKLKEADLELRWDQMMGENWAKTMETWKISLRVDLRAPLM